MSSGEGLRRVLDALDALGHGAVGKGGYYAARCPAHDDSHPSLSVQHIEPRHGDRGGRARVRCHAGCDERDVLHVLGLELRDLYDDPVPKGGAVATREHVYLSSSGQLLGAVQRFEPKTFRPMTHNGQTWQQRSSDELKTTPYRLPAVVAAIDRGEVVYVVEGEKDADTLATLGITATCNAGGAEKWTERHAQWLRDAHVIVCRDRDDPGRKHAQKVIDSLDGFAASVRLVEPAEGKDVTDHLAAGRTLDDLVDVPLAAVEVASDIRRRLITGGTFIHDAPTTVPAIWGSGDQVLWSAGEPLIITGPTGVGKTTLGGQPVAGRLGLIKSVLGYPVQQGDRRVLYLAMDRPAQIRRALARLLRNYPRHILDERLVVWPGPPPLDLARHPEMLLTLARDADADTVVLDSLKDAAVKLSDEETGQGISRAMNHCVTEGVEVLAYHHQTKRGGGGAGKPNSLSDVYGSAWITAGAGSVLLLWGAAGDPIVELSHLKQPADTIGPLKILHDHVNGTTEIWHSVDILTLLTAGPRSAGDVARLMYDGDIGESDVAKTRRKLERLVAEGHAVKLDGPTRGTTKGGARGGASGALYAARTHPVLTDVLTDAGYPAEVDRRTDERPTHTHISAGQMTDVLTDATDAPDDRRSTLPLEGGATTSKPTCNRCGNPARPSQIQGEWLCCNCAYPAGGCGCHDRTGAA